MADWLSTTQAAERLGTTLATVRALVESGQLIGTAEARVVRRRWRIDAASVEAYLDERGRLDLRREASMEIAAARRSDIKWLAAEIAALRSELKERPSSVEHDRILAQVEQQRAQLVALGEVALRLRARAEAVEEAERHHAKAVEHLTAAVAAQSQASAALRRALLHADDALGQFLVPGSVTE